MRRLPIIDKRRIGPNVVADETSSAMSPIAGDFGR